jgi:hypothetical protein
MIKRRKFLNISTIAGASLFFPFESCKKPLNVTNAETNDLVNDYFTGLAFVKCNTEKGAYQFAEEILFSFNVVNLTAANIIIKELHISITNISDSKLITKVNIANNVAINSTQQLALTDNLIWTVPGNAPLGAYCIYIGATLENNAIFSDTYASFFRVVVPADLLTYSITDTKYHELDIHCLNGGLSAEYAVAKAAESLSKGVAHSWYTSSPGSGPNSVYSTAGFLDAAINYTVAYYDQNFGVAASFETVIFSTGVASIPYLSRVTKAPVLPFQFLVSADSVKEIIGILNYNTEIKNYSSFAALGYDGSISMAVSWIKLLDIPQQYLDFLTRHGVKSVIFAGIYGANATGETLARKIEYNANPNTGYNNGDLFLMYPGGGSAADNSNLNAKIQDLANYSNKLEPGYRNISDWESGLTEEQVNNFARKIKSSLGITNVRLISATDSLSMYNLATYLTLTFMQKNQIAFASDGGPDIKGIAINPYLLAHPSYETRIKYIPMLFWQGNNSNDDVSRLLTTIQQSVLLYFPTTEFNSLAFWVNTSQNFGGFQAATIQSALQANGINNINMNDNTKDEVWDPSDGMNAICEKVAVDIATNILPSIYESWDNLLTPLTLEDMDALAKRHPEISVTAF